MDRNAVCLALLAILGWSLSARRAWIEIEVKSFDRDYQPGVALRKESVDRNTRMAAALRAK